MYIFIKYFKNVSREYDEFQVNIHLRKLRYIFFVLFLSSPLDATQIWGHYFCLLIPPLATTVRTFIFIAERFQLFSSLVDSHRNVNPAVHCSSDLKGIGYQLGTSSVFPSPSEMIVWA